MAVWQCCSSVRLATSCTSTLTSHGSRVSALKHIEQRFCRLTASPLWLLPSSCAIAHLTPVGGLAREGARPQVQLEDLSGQAVIGGSVRAGILVGAVNQAGPAANNEDPVTVLRHRQT